MARFFIDRPVFAIVIAIVIVILGSVAIPNLPIASFPEVVPPVVQITASYLGSNALDLEKTVAQPIEEQLAGLDGMLYFLSSSANNGSITILVTFKLGTNPDIASVQTQNKVNIALPRLPPEVQRQGVVVKKVSSAFLMAVGLVSPDGRYDSLFLNNYAQINLLNQIGSLQGVGDTRLASQLVYSMRVWVDPDKMSKLGITATDINNAIAAQNRQNPAGSTGQAPAPPGTDFQYAVNAPGRLTDPAQFGDIIVRALPDASLLRIRDIGRVELGAQNYAGFSRLDGKPFGNTIVYLSPGANAVETAKSVKAFMEEAKKSFPPGVDYVIPYDSTMFVTTAITDVVITLLEAIGLVILVVFIFLQNWRATLIPLLTVPVAVVGTFALFPLLGFSINITSMFGLVLAIGIVVDDAIVVVEAVQRNMDDGMPPREATMRAMDQVSAPVVAIAAILAAVFIPVAFLGGISGQLYRQFALTIAASVLISAFSALSLSPALAALILRPQKKTSRGPLAWLFGYFNRAFEWTTNKYLAGVGMLIRRSVVALMILGVFWLSAGWLFKKLPNGFLPDEDQGAFFVSVHLPDGASIDRNSLATAKIENVIANLPGVDHYFLLGGTDIATQTSSSNVSTVIVTLKPWDERKAPDQQLPAILAAAQRGFSKVPEAFSFSFGLPPILGLSLTGGFQFMLEDRTGGDIQQLGQVADSLVDATRQRPELANVLSTFRGNVPAYDLKMDVDKLQTLGVPVTDAYNTLQTFLGGLYVNDFNVFSHTWQVLIQAEPNYRNQPSDINRFYTRAADGTMVPLGTVVTLKPTTGPDVVYRYNRFPAIQILGGPSPGTSSGVAVDVMEKVAAASLPAGYSYEWTGTTYQQKLAQGNEGIIFGFAAVLVFLCLAALYESWSIPFAVLLALPLGLFGALMAAYIRDYPYDIYTQIGIVTLIGLAAKNAILIVEFAKDSHEQELMSFRDAAMHAAKLRLRPILMTSFAFILGVVPLVIATGASSASRRSLGTAVFGGMLAATLIAVFLVPVQYYVIETLVERRKGAAPDAGTAPKPGPGPSMGPKPITGTAPEFAE
jgi:hydrophobe/amphiphile efflux-1 (HAE1) family protein